MHMTQIVNVAFAREFSPRVSLMKVEEEAEHKKQ